MASAGHSLGGGSLLLETRLSLEPATVTDRRYQELFQTGETGHMTKSGHCLDLFAK
jgi:hypothetical protein